MTRRERQIRKDTIEALKYVLERNGFKRYRKTNIWKKDKYRVRFNPLKIRVEKRLSDTYWARIISIFNKDLPLKYQGFVEYLASKGIIQEQCDVCGRPVHFGTGLFVDRVVSLDKGFICRECISD